MLSHYHPGVYGNGEWTCCKAKVKDKTGCRESTQEKGLPPNRRNTMVSLSECVYRNSSSVRTYIAYIIIIMIIIELVM